MMKKYKLNNNHPLRWVWHSMLTRCNNPLYTQFQLYGGRGIKVCDRWSNKVNGFNNFVQDMGPRPEGFQLDRIDNSRDYNPENCRWVTPSQNLMNRRKFKQNKSGFKGVSRAMGNNKLQETYRSAIAYNDSDYVIGTFFKTAEDAAVAYDLASHIFFKEFGIRNFPELSINELIVRNKELFANRLNVKSKYLNVLVSVLNDHK